MFPPHHMRIRRMFMWLVICVSFQSNASNEMVTEFAFKTGTSDAGVGCSSTGTLVVTLWFDTTIYQGSTKPKLTETWFTFTANGDPGFRVIGRNCSNIAQPKIMFAMYSPDAVCIDQVRVNTQSGDLYGIDKVYRDSTLYDEPKIDNEPWAWNSGYGPYKQIMYFDTTRPNIYINDAEWSDGTDVDPFSDIYQCVTTGLTAKYGDDGGDFYSVLDQGRVYAMQDWGLETNNGNKYLQIRGWKADSQSTETVNVYGNGRTRSLCTPFTLSSDDYITGYQIWFDSNAISGLTFWTRNGRTLSCIGISDSSTTSYANSFDYGPFSFSYLTGWNVWAGAYIDQIQFQFTQSLLTASPTQIPSVSPSAIPTYNTNHPSQVPSSNPTDSPTFSTDNSSNAPSSNPMYNATDPPSTMSTIAMYNITPSDIIETEQNKLNDNKPLVNVFAVIVFILGLCCVCAVVGLVAIGVYSKKHNIQFVGKKLGNEVRDVDVDVDVDEDDVECNVEQPRSEPKEIEGLQKQSQIDVELCEGREPNPPNLKVERSAVCGDNDVGIASRKQGTDNVAPIIVYNMDNASDEIVIGDDAETGTQTANAVWSDPVVYNMDNAGDAIVIGDDMDTTRS